MELDYSLANMLVNVLLAVKHSHYQTILKKLIILENVLDMFKHSYHEVELCLGIAQYVIFGNVSFNFEFIFIGDSMVWWLRQVTLMQMTWVRFPVLAGKMVVGPLYQTR